MKRLALLFAALAMTACGTAKTYRTWNYPGLARGGGTLVVEEVNRARLREFCEGGGPVNFDNGDPINAITRERNTACHQPGHIVYLQGRACVLAHELCHESGLPASVCDKAYHSDQFCK